MIRVFLSSPYSSPLPSIMRERADIAGDACAWLWQQGYAAYSPIAHWHGIAVRRNLPTNANAWIDLNKRELAASDAVAFLHLDGWRDSAGMAMEREWARNLPQAVIEPRDGSFAVVQGQLWSDDPHGLAYCDGQWIRID